MKINHVGQKVYDTQDLINLTMSGVMISEIADLTVSDDVNLTQLIEITKSPHNLCTWRSPVSDRVSMEQFDREQQTQWFMPEEYQNFDIAEYVLSCCETDAELQRAGKELLMFQQREMFSVLKYLKFLVDTMRSNGVIWGVGRGSCVASFVLYKLGVHCIDSLYYDLDPEEFLR